MIFFYTCDAPFASRSENHQKQSCGRPGDTFFCHTKGTQRSHESSSSRKTQCRQGDDPFFVFMSSSFCVIEAADGVQPAVATVSPSARRCPSPVSPVTVKPDPFISLLCRSLRKKRGHPARGPALRPMAARWTDLRPAPSPPRRLPTLRLLLRAVSPSRLRSAWHLTDSNLSPLDRRTPFLRRGLCVSLTVPLPLMRFETPFSFF